jgi:hypothetical protein
MKMKAAVVCITVIGFLFVPVQTLLDVSPGDTKPNDDYIWPTDATHTITSTFGEFRKTHFHEGIDISTNNRTGYKVFAARDGYVWRISISQTGYGKALSLKHGDGFVTIYAHLKSFSDTLNRLVRDEQIRLERYPIDIVFEPFAIPVKKGNVIAYSGNTGIGSPHLHFEIRDESFNPVNPQLFEQIAKTDRLPPSISSIAVIPLDNNSSVSGKQKPLLLNAVTLRRGNYRLAQKVQASGRIGIAVNARDHVEGTWHRGGIHRLELSINDSLSFSAQLDRLNATEPKLIFLYYNLPLLKNGRGRFQQLFFEYKTSLPFFDNQLPGAGILDARTLGEGEHSFTIICKDVHGNAAQLSGTIALSHPPQREPSFIAGNPIEDGNKEEDVFTIPDDKSGWFSFDDNTLQVVYDSAAVFKPLNVRVEKLAEEGGVAFRLTPQNVLLNKGVRIFLRSPDPTNKFFSLFERNSYRFELRRTSYDSTTKYFSTMLTNTLCDIALLKDTVPPQISMFDFKINRKRPTAQFRVFDDLAGIDAKEIKTYIDGEFVIPEIDDRWRVVCKREQPLTKGAHEFTVVVKDNMGNRSSTTRKFTVQ